MLPVFNTGKIIKTRGARANSKGDRNGDDRCSKNKSIREYKVKSGAFHTTMITQLNSQYGEYEERSCRS